jgi:hypothetical protein
MQGAPSLQAVRRPCSDLPDARLVPAAARRLPAGRAAGPVAARMMPEAPSPRVARRPCSDWLVRALAEQPSLPARVVGPVAVQTMTEASNLRAARKPCSDSPGVPVPVLVSARAEAAQRSRPGPAVGPAGAWAQTPEVPSPRAVRTPCSDWRRAPAPPRPQAWGREAPVALVAVRRPRFARAPVEAQPQSPAASNPAVVRTPCLDSPDARAARVLVATRAVAGGQQRQSGPAPAQVAAMQAVVAPRSGRRPASLSAWLLAAACSRRRRAEPDQAAPIRAAAQKPCWDRPAEEVVTAARRRPRARVEARVRLAEVAGQPALVAEAAERVARPTAAAPARWSPAPAAAPTPGSAAHWAR